MGIDTGLEVGQGRWRSLSLGVIAWLVNGWLLVSLNAVRESGVKSINQLNPLCHYQRVGILILRTLFHSLFTSIESYETPRLQLSLAILMKRKFNWIGEIEVFDPILSAIEAQVLEALGCSVLSVNEQGCRCAIKPTLFYMPHCEAGLYNNFYKPIREQC